jgi:steroid delta-isomerase-like uncharacterized protein
MRAKKNLSSLAAFLIIAIAIISCNNGASTECIELTTANEQLNANLKMYETVWHDIVNKRQIDLINETNFDTNITLITAPENIVGIEGFKAYYQNYLTGFSDITFTIEDAFGQGDKIVKHWKFTGKHTGEFFGIPATGKAVSVEGVTLVVMKNGKIAQERDFLDNLEFMQQLGLIPRQ